MHDPGNVSDKEGRQRERVKHVEIWKPQESRLLPPSP